MKPEEMLNLVLSQKGLKIAVAESCSGGLISSRITDVAGSSDYFEAGLITYSNRAKEQFLSVPAGLIARKGAVSEEVARKMAEGVRRATGADIGLSVTGIAGPSGGTPEKPVGTVYMALSAERGTFARKHVFSGGRRAIKRQTADEALGFALRYLEGDVG